MQNMHQYLFKRYDWYRSWHEYRYHRHVHLLLVLAVAFFSISATNSSFRQLAAISLSTPPQTDQVVKVAGLGASSNSFLVKVKSSAKRSLKVGPTAANTGITSLDNLNKKYKATRFEVIAKVGKNSKKDAAIFQWYKVTLSDPEVFFEAKDGRGDSSEQLTKIQRILREYKANPNVEAVEENFAVSAVVVPNDPYYSSTGSWGQTYPDLWGMQKINAASAWDQTTGSSSIVVADVDTGVDRNHPDLAANMWVNTKEIPGNGIDDDSNGYKDDYYGWDFNGNDNDPMDDMGHGTHTAGTIAAVGNNATGVVGVNWTAKIMALKFLDSSGSGSLSNGIQALQYAADMGARVSSNSWGCGCNSQAMDDAIKYEHDRGMVVAVAAGNSAIDALDFSPASADDAITVSATDSNDLLASFSNVGEKIDVGAPGVQILSTRSSQDKMCPGVTVVTIYCHVSGTSMATPHVAGLAALLLSKNSSLTNEEVRQIIRTGATDLGLVGKDSKFGYGRISAAGSMALATTPPLTPYITSPRSRTIVIGTSPILQITGSVGGPNFLSYKLEVGSGRTPTSWTQVATSSTQPTTPRVLGSLDTTNYPEGKYIIRLTAFDTAGKAFQFQTNDITIDNFDAVINFPSGLLSIGSTDIVGTAVTKNGMPFSIFVLEWSIGGGPWSSAGITHVNGGTQPIANGKLGTWNTAGFTDGQVYTLRLTVNSTFGSNQQASVSEKVDKDLVAGWPKYLSNAYVNHIASVLADLDGDGTKELVFQSPEGKVYAYRKDGSSLPGFPVTLTARTPSDGYESYDDINVADLDGDGKQEIIGTYYDTPTYVTKSFIIKSDGSMYPGWNQSIVSQFPAIVDLDGDGQKDIVGVKAVTWVSRTDVVVNAYHTNGTSLIGFPKTYVIPPVGFSAGEIFPGQNAPASVVDLDNDGKPEIAWAFSNYLYLFDNQGNVLPGWPFIVPLYTSSYTGTSKDYNMTFDDAMASGDVYGDGQKEVFALSTYACIASSGGGFSGLCYAAGPTVMYGFKKDGTVLSGWPKNDVTDSFRSDTTYATYAPALTDIDGDGKDEIIVGGYPSAIFDVEGKKNLTNAPSFTLQPSLSDVDGDGKVEIVAAFYNAISIMKQDGVSWLTYLQKTITGNAFYSSVSIADMDNDGQMEMAAIDRPYGWSSTGLVGGINSIYVWNLPKSSANAANFEWPMFSHDPARSGRLVVGAVAPDPTPPTTSITSPASGATVSGTTNVTADALDNFAVTRVELYVNGTLSLIDSSSPYSFPWDTTKTANGTAILTTKAYDAAGNVGISPSVTVNVSNVSGHINLDPVSLNFTGVLGGATPTPKSVTLSNSGTASLNWTISTNQSWCHGTPASGATSISSATLLSISVDAPSTIGSFTCLTTVTDPTADNNPQAVTVMYTVSAPSDAIAPTVTITAPGNNTAVPKKSTYAITANATDNIGVTKVEFYVNDALKCTDTTAPYTCAWKVPAAPNKPYRIQGKAYDVAGNVGTSAVVNVTSQ